MDDPTKPKRILDRAEPQPEPEPIRPAHWDLFLCHGQASIRVQCRELVKRLRADGCDVYYDVEQPDKSRAAVSRPEPPCACCRVHVLPCQPSALHDLHRRSGLSARLSIPRTC